MTQYTSIHSGVDIDKAVSYYKSIDAYGRSVINCPIQISNWKSVSELLASTSEDNVEDRRKLNGITTNYYIKITLNGTYKIGGAPIIYFIDSTGQKWEIDHIFDNGILNPQANTSYSIYCLSNTNVYSGRIVMVGTLSNTKDGGEDITITVNS
jgi:hypothetical protein